MLVKSWAPYRRLSRCHSCHSHQKTSRGSSDAGLTEIEAGWLLGAAEPLVTLSPPLDTPPPQYSRAADAVVAMHAVTYGRHDWPLPSVERPHPDVATQARVFAAALLAGMVLPAFAGPMF